RLHEHFCVPREGCGMARDVDDAPRTYTRHMCDGGFGAGSRRIDHDDVPRLPIKPPLGLGKVGGNEARVLHVVELCVANCSRDEPRLTLDAEQLTGGACEGKTEITETAVEVEHAIRGLEIGQLHRGSDHLLVDG